MSQSANFLVALTIISWLAGCEKSSDTIATKSAKPPEGSDAQSLEVTASKDRANLPTQRVAAREKAQQAVLDPCRDGWDSEALHELTSQQLSRLADWLSRSDEADPEELSEVISANYSGPPLRPADLIELIH